MDAVDLIKGRRSVRNFKDVKVSRDLIKEIVDLSRFAPSWTNAQIARYYVIDKDDMLEWIKDNALYGFKHNVDILSKATGAVVLCFEKGRSGNLEKYGIVDSYSDFNTWEEFDSGIACQTFCLAAHSKGVGTCIFGVIDKQSLADFISLPDTQRISALIVYGYPDENKDAKARKAVDDILVFMD